MKKMWSKEEVVNLIKSVVYDLLHASSITLNDGEVTIEEAHIVKLMDGTQFYFHY